MNKRERAEIHNLQGQWIFVVIATILALMGGIVVCAIYDLMRESADWSPLTILFVFGPVTVWMIDVFSYMFDNLGELRKDPGDSMRPVLKRYFLSRLRTFRLYK